MNSLFITPSFSPKTSKAGEEKSMRRQEKNQAKYTESLRKFKERKAQYRKHQARGTLGKITTAAVAACGVTGSKAISCSTIPIASEVNSQQSEHFTLQDINRYESKMQSLNSILGLPEHFILPKPNVCAEIDTIEYGTCMTTGGYDIKTTSGGYENQTGNMPGGYAFRFGPIPNEIENRKQDRITLNIKGKKCTKACEKMASQ